MRVQFGIFEKFTSAYLFQIAREKSCDYLLILSMKKFRDGYAKETARVSRSQGKITPQIIYMKKFLHSDWMRAV